MRAQTAPSAYSGLQKALHWGIALLVLAMIPVGLYMTYRGGATNFDALTNTLYTWHKTIGFLVLLLVVWRIAVRRARGAPDAVATLTPIERLVSDLVHKALYALMGLVPLLGWAAVSAYPARGVLFGLSLPPIMPVNQSLAGFLFAAHKFAAFALAALIAAHFGAAMMHWLIKKDGVMRRMLP
ncbi:CybB Cytochrome B561 [Rhabdaerophilaceae bacterium]